MPDLPFLIETFDTLSSTQDAMRARLESGEDVHGLVIRALEQTGGRGQRARDWLSTRGGSYQTLAARDREPPALNQPYAAVVIALGLAQTLPEYGLKVQVKWPNDLHYRGKKVAGILCEYLRGHLLIGVGVNVENAVPEGATAFRGLDVEGVSNLVLAGVQRGLTLLEDGCDLPSAFAPFDALYGQDIEVAVGDELLRGVARGVDAGGCLKLEIPTGTRKVCHGHPRSALVRRKAAP
jgi:BirA family transcriptional regulator, biotin operon repressor / biotin---[acetyl-CoA-carboxylase] ligase